MSIAKPDHRAVLDYYVYRLYDSGGDLLYVGMTRNLDQRKAQHRANKSWWPDVARYRLVGPMTRSVAREREMEIIQAERPRYNKRGYGRKLPSGQRVVSRTACFRIPTAEWREAKEIAHANGRTLTSVIIEYMRAYVEGREDELWA